MSRSNPNRFGGIASASSEPVVDPAWTYVPRANVLTPTNPMANNVDLDPGQIVVNPIGGYANPSFINPVRDPAWLYVPRAHIDVPVSTTYYYLNEDALSHFLTEDDLYLFIQEG